MFEPLPNQGNKATASNEITIDIAQALFLVLNLTEIFSDLIFSTYGTAMLGGCGRWWWVVAVEFSVNLWAKASA